MEFFDIVSTRNDIHDSFMACSDCPLSASKNGKGLPCNDLMFRYPSEFLRIINRWNDDHKVDWDKVPTDTMVLVSDEDGTYWYRRYFAKYEDGLIYTFPKGYTAWSSFGQGALEIWRFAKLREEFKQ